MMKGNCNIIRKQLKGEEQAQDYTIVNRGLAVLSHMMTFAPKKRLISPPHPMARYGRFHATKVVIEAQRQKRLEWPLKTGKTGNTEEVQFDVSFN